MILNLNTFVQVTSIHKGDGFESINKFFNRDSTDFM